MEKSSYYPQLDSIRAISFISVFIHHVVVDRPASSLFGDFMNHLWRNMLLGLDVFFILSSFLLTWIGINEYERNAGFSFKQFFVRRVLRIWPLYYLIMAFSFLLLPYLSKRFHLPVSLPDPAWYLFFVSNFYYADHVYFLKFLWTLSVEEQFYLILGLCLKVVNRHLTTVLVIFGLVSVIFSLAALGLDIHAYTHTITYFFDFAAGGLAAIVLFKRLRLIRLLQQLNKMQTILFYSYLPLHFILLYIFRKISTDIQYDRIDLVARWLFICYVAIFILEQLTNSCKTRFLEKNRFLIFTGRISYGLYSIHGITLTVGGILFYKMPFFPEWLRVIALFAVNYGVAVLSFIYFESPFLRLKKQFRR